MTDSDLTGVFPASDGVFVELEHLEIRRTYSGWLEGDLKEINEIIIQNLAEKKVVQTHWPVLIVDPKVSPLPKFLWIGNFRKPGISGLCVCWFTTSLTDPIDKVISSALASVDWDANAAPDYSEFADP